MTIQANQGFGVSVFGAVSGGGGGSTSPGGSSGQVQYNNGGAFGGMSGTTWTDASQSLAIASTGTGTGITTSSPVLNLSQTWNNAGTGFTGLNLAITGTALGAGSYALNITNTSTSANAGGLYIKTGGSDANQLVLDVASGQRYTGMYFNNNGTSKTYIAHDNNNSIFLIVAYSNPVGLGQGSDIFVVNNANTKLASNSSYTFTNTASGSSGARVGTSDTFLSRGGAAATLQLGAADAAAPVAQTFKVQSGTAGASATTVSISGTSLTIAGTVTGTIAIGHAVTGTGVSAGTLITAGSGTSWTVNNSQTVGPITAYFNSVGADFTIRGSQGSGPSAGGSIIFQVAPAGSAATTAQNAYSTALTIASDKSATFAGITSVLSNTWHISSDGVQRTYYTSSGATLFKSSTGFTFRTNDDSNLLRIDSGANLYFDKAGAVIGLNFGGTTNVILVPDAANTLALRNGTNAQTFNVYGSYTSATNYQRVVVKTLREVSSALSGATYVSTIAIPAYALLVGVTTRVNTAITGATSYSVGDGTTANLWGNNIGIALNSQSQTSDFTAIGAVGAAATSRTVTLTANGSNFTGGVVEICLHYLTTEAD